MTQESSNLFSLVIVVYVEGIEILLLTTTFRGTAITDFTLVALGFYQLIVFLNRKTILTYGICSVFGCHPNQLRDGV